MDAGPGHHKSSGYATNCRIQRIGLEIQEAVHSQHHLGTNGALHSLRNSYFWTKMIGDTRIFCRRCITCQRCMPTNTGREPIQEMNISNRTTLLESTWVHYAGLKEGICTFLLWWNSSLGTSSCIP